MFKGTQIAVGTGAAVELTAGAETDTTAGRSFAILSATVDLFLGGDNSVTATGGTRGAKLATGAPLSCDLAPGEKVWAVGSASGTVEVIETGV